MSQQAPISKTRRKTEMLELQELGVELVGLDDEQLAALDLPDALRDAVVQARSITRFEPRRRQLQYIGKLMRRVDPAPIRAMLDERRARAGGQNAVLRRVEAWRERLLTDRDGLAELLAEQPDANVSRLRALIESARTERAEARPPHSYRALFQALRDLLGDA
jgi:ribosome-associated protein